jgi:hypothetical protein
LFIISPTIYASTFFSTVWIVYYLPYKFKHPLSSIQCGLFIISPTSLNVHFPLYSVDCCRGDNKQSTLYRRKWTFKLEGEIINNPHCIEGSGHLNLSSIQCGLFIISPTSLCIHFLLYSVDCLLSPLQVYQTTFFYTVHTVKREVDI